MGLGVDQVGEAPLERWSRGRNELRTHAVRVVCLGGGTGLPVVLRGLARRRRRGAGAGQVDITAVVAMGDDGGSSGRLRRARGVPPPGDVRNCLLALADPESALRPLFRYRFEGSRGVAGHVVGNLLLAALAELKGDFVEAVRCAGELLGVEGTVLPSTTVPIQLAARRSDGMEVLGERNLARGGGAVERVWLVPRCPAPVPGLLDRLRDAELITLGPGSLFSSVMPNLLVDGVAEAMHESRGLRVLVANLMTQPGETGGLRLEEHVRAILEHVGPVLDVVLFNTRPPSAEALAHYARRGAEPVVGSIAEIERLGIRAVGEDLLAAGRSVRHDPRKIARALLRLPMRRM